MPPNYRNTQVNLTVLTARRHVMESETKHNATALTPPTASTNDNRKMKNYMYMIGNHTPTKTIKSQSTTSRFFKNSSMFAVARSFNVLMLSAAVFIIFSLTTGIN